MLRKRRGGARLSALLAIATLLAVALSGLAIAQTARKKVAPRQPSVSRTGRLQPPASEEARKQASDLSVALQRPVEALSVTTLNDGAMMVDLDGGFQHVAMATFDANGDLVLTCVDDPASAEVLLRSANAPAATPRVQKKEAGKKAAPKRAPAAAEEK